MVRGLNPWPGVTAMIEDDSYKLWQVSAKKGETQNNPGEIVSANKSELLIQCGEGHLSIEMLQKPGKNKMTIQQFMASRSHWFR